MAWDVEGTKRRLKDAAIVEFAERGPDGTTMSRIAERAGINKERLYKYYGDKDALFETVLAEELDRLAGVVPPAGDTVADLGEWAGHAFDYHAAHPHLVRLLQWEGLAGRGIADRLNRETHYREKVRAVERAQRDGLISDAVDPAHLVFLVIAIATWWFSVPQVAQMLSGGAPDDDAEHARRRASVVAAARRLGASGQP
ncbi:TetR family transcriptional regulator [Plantactinospora siamensis]|uniref:TetR family transcriptional regulator n=1 Tax=Plantactinospora siamensis TaxID=555372 RepID=A0ABV6NYS7_9ACTN